MRVCGIISAMKDRNPFVIYGYEGPETFCDREVESEKLLQAIANGRNVTLLAERRIGKTGLIQHVFQKLRARGLTQVVYVDIFATRNLEEFTKTFAAAIIGLMDSNVERALEAATRFFKSFRPVLAVDPITGAHTFSFGLQALPNVEATLKECFAYLATRGNCVVAIDEFQQVGCYPEKGTEALLRSYVQFLPETRFIFAGSKHHLMVEMFATAKRPFYNSTQTIPLERIDHEKYFDFASYHLTKADVRLTREVFDQITQLFDGITWYVQVMLNRLYERRSATAEDVRSVVGELLSEKNWEYATLLKTLPEGTVLLLKAVALAGRAKAVTSADFMATHRLKGSSSVHLSLKSALEDELLYETDDGYVVYDRLFALWLTQHYAR